MPEIIFSFEVILPKCNPNSTYLQTENIRENLTLFQERGNIALPRTLLREKLIYLTPLFIHPRFFLIIQNHTFKHHTFPCLKYSKVSNLYALSRQSVNTSILSKSGKSYIGYARHLITDRILSLYTGLCLKKA